MSMSVSMSMFQVRPPRAFFSVASRLSSPPPSLSSSLSLSAACRVRCLSSAAAASAASASAASASARGTSSSVSRSSDDAYVVLTREAGKNDNVVDALKQIDVIPHDAILEVPMVFTETIQSGIEQLADALRNLKETNVQFVCVTSPEAMAHYVTAYRMAGDPGGNAAALACVGGGTAKALKRELERQTTACPVPPTCEFVPTRATAKDLAAELPLSENTRVLYPASARAKKELQDGLGERGCEVLRINTYTTVAATVDRLTEEQVHAARNAAVVCFASPSAAMAWVDAFGVSAKAACIGRTSYDACIRLGWKEEDVFCPDAPGVDGFARSASEAWKQ